MDQKSLVLTMNHILPQICNHKYICVLKLYLREIIVHILIGIPDIMFCTYVYNYVNICFTLQRTICEISLCTKYVILFK